MRYSEQDLQEFKALIEKKLQKASEELEYLRRQMLEICEMKKSDRGDWIDDSANDSNMEMLNTMAIRLRKHIQDLENALLRIKIKTYGICFATGKLIDKKRLLAVPTTTMGLAAKKASKKKPPKEKSTSQPKKKKKEIITTRKKKSTAENTGPVHFSSLEEEEEEVFDPTPDEDNIITYLDMEDMPDMEGQEED